MMQTRSFVGMDVHKATISISVAEDGRNGTGAVSRSDSEHSSGCRQDGEAARRGMVSSTSVTRRAGAGTASIASSPHSGTGAPWSHRR